LTGGPGATGDRGPPTPFSLGDEAQLRGLIENAGFAEIEIRAVEIARRHASFEDFWELTLDLSRSFHDAVMSQPEAAIADIRAELQARLAPYAEPDGGLAVPSRTLVARAEA
ncbi:MAG TPA: hypothetical protein VIB59_05185, partial [Solirubrobacteraceae bacterium]